MKDIASYLVELQEVKEDIKSSIERKGVTVTGGLSSYSSAIDKIEQGGGSCILEDKTISISENGITVVNPSDGYDGLSKVDVNVDVQPNLFTFEEELTKNGEYSYSVNFPGSPYDGFGDFKIDVNVQPRLQSLTYNVVRNGEYDIIPTDDYNAIGNVKLTVDVPDPTINLEDKTISITENGTTVVNPSDGYDGLSKVTITTNVPTTGGKSKWYNGMKCNYNTLTNVDFLSDFDFGEVSDFFYMFSNCSSLTTIPLLDTSSAIDMTYMFYKCDNITTIPLLDTSNVTSMDGMFSNCSSLVSIPLLDTSNVTDMGGMFSNCSSLITIPQLYTSNVIDMSYMFGGCYVLKSLPILDCARVSTMFGIFQGSRDFDNLTDLGGFKFLKVSITSSFLDKCPNLTVESLVNVIHWLSDLTINGGSGQTLKFGTTNLGKLTAEQIAIATNKGWTLI